MEDRFNINPVMKSSIFRVEIPGEPDAYIVEIKDENPQRPTETEIVCRVWYESKGEEYAFAFPLRRNPQISAERMAQHVVLGLIDLKQWRPKHED